MILEEIVKMIRDRRDTATREILGGLSQEEYRERLGSYKACTKLLGDIEDLASRLRRGEKE